MTQSEFEGATRLREAHERAAAERDELRTLLLRVWVRANPSILEDDPAGVRLPPDLNKEIEAVLARLTFDESVRGK